MSLTRVNDIVDSVNDGPRVTLCECFARDGLQHEPALRAHRHQARAGRALRRARLPARRGHLLLQPEGGAAVRRCLANSCKSLERRPGVFYKATCANVRAVERALADLDAGFGANEISLLVSATESHSQQEPEPHARRAVAEHRGDGRARRRDASASSARSRSPSAARSRARSIRASVVSDVQRFHALGVEHVALGDTIGMATPRAVRDMFSVLKVKGGWSRSRTSTTRAARGWSTTSPPTRPACASSIRRSAASAGIRRR